MAKSPSQRAGKDSRHRQKKKPRSPAKTVNIWGIHPVLEALKACPNAIREIVLDGDRAGRRLDQIRELAQKEAVPVSDAAVRPSTGKLKPGDQAEQERSQGVSASMVLPTLSLDELLDGLDGLAGPPLLLALDSIQDPHNLGAIIRSAVAAGVHGIILPKDRSAAITGTVIKVSAGSVFHAAICRVTNLVSSLKALKEKNIWILGTVKDASRPIYETDLAIPVCLVIGSEGKGLRPLVAEQCDLKIAIPMQGTLDSLNVSVAAGIVLFEAVRQRRKL